MRVHANCSSVAPLAGSKRSIEAIRASRPQEMKSSTSQREGSSRTFLKTMYLTSGAYVITRRLRTCTSLVALYSRHRESASSEEVRVGLMLLDCDFMGTDFAPRRAGLTDMAFIGSRPQCPHHLSGVIASPIEPEDQARIHVWVTVRTVLRLRTSVRTSARRSWSQTAAATR